MHLAALHEARSTARSGDPRRRPTREEKRIASRLRKRDRGVLAELYATYGGATFGFLVRAIGDRGAAEDVQQQVFLEVWQRGPDYDPSRASIPTWIMTIARSRAIDHRRRRVPEPRDPEIAVLQAGADHGDLDELHDRWWLTAVLAELPDEEAAPLRLRFAHGLTQQEIAVALELPLGTVKTRMSRALARLRPVLAEHGSVRPATAKEGM
jgi:RNA polymerase sigma-70 factor (ECF subfamily)